MPEQLPKAQERKEAEKLDAASVFNKFADNFFALADKPETTYAQQNEFLEKSIYFTNLASAEKDPSKVKEYNNKSEEYAEKYKKSRRHKYVAGNYAPSLTMARQFLDTTDKVPWTEKNRLVAEIENINNLINKERPTGMTPGVVDRVTKFIKEIQKYTK